jgi:hypothetical protein
MRRVPALSDLCLDLLARQRDSGGELAPETEAMLDKVRPDGPIRR